MSFLHNIFLYRSLWNFPYSSNSHRFDLPSLQELIGGVPVSYTHLDVYKRQGFGITLSQFFQEEDSVYLTKEQKKLLDLWAKLSPAQREAVTKMLCAFLYIEEEP